MKMYLHLGNDIIVKKSDIVGIFDIENTTTGKNTGHLLERAQKEGNVVNVSYELPKSFVVCMEKGKERVYVCQLSAATLRKRDQDKKRGYFNVGKSDDGKSEL